MMKIRNLLFFSVSSFSLIAIGVSCAPQLLVSTQSESLTLKTPKASGTPKIEGSVPLSTVVTQSLNGISSETPEQRELLRKEALAFIKFKHAGFNSKKRRILAEKCRDEETQNPFCNFMLREAPSRTFSHSHISRARARSLAKSIRAGKIDLASYADESLLNQTFKQFPKYEGLDKTVQAALRSPSCPSSALLTALGMKTEAFLPDQKFRQLAVQLYQRSIDCALETKRFGSDISAVKASFRLGLLQVWDRNFEGAEKTFSKIFDHPEASDYRVRVGYWRYYCAKQLKDTATQEKMRETLMREYPLSLHGMLISGGHTLELKDVSSRDPDLIFRSKDRPDLNVGVRAAETLVEMDVPELGLQILDSLVDQVDHAEPAFQLYIAVLLKRAGDVNRRFHLLVGVFRDDPSLMSQATLEMLYPLRRFEMVKDLKSKVDPYVVISLVRQESAFNEKARSPAGALGLMQLMPGTARHFERVSKLGLYNPLTNMRVGVKFFSVLLNRYEGDTELALAAYNAGPDNVDEWRRRYPIDNRLLFLDLIPFHETRDYVASIARNYYWYMKIYEKKDPAAVGARAPFPSFALADAQP